MSEPKYKQNEIVSFRHEGKDTNVMIIRVFKDLSDKDPQHMYSVDLDGLKITVEETLLKPIEINKPIIDTVNGIFGSVKVGDVNTSNQTISIDIEGTKYSYNKVEIVTAVQGLMYAYEKLHASST